MLNRSKRLVVTTLFLLASPGLIGCSRMISTGISEAKGGTAKLTIIKAVAPGGLRQYKHVKLETFENTMGSALPGNAIGELKAETLKDLSEHAELFKVIGENGPTDVPILIVRGQVIHYHSGGGIGAILGKFSQLICRVQLVDAASAEVLGEANSNAMSKAISRAGVSDLSKAVAKSLTKWIEEHHSNE